MNVLNRDDVQEALYESGRNWNIDAIIDEAEYHAMINGEFDEDFTYEDRDTEYRFECLKPTTYIYDEEGELVQGMDDEEYWLEWIQDKKTGRDIYRKSSPQYEEMFKDTRKASANKAQGVKADEKKEVFVYKAMDVNGNGVFKVFYDDGTYEILKGGRAYERSWGDYDKFVSMETLRHATAPPKGKARKASARNVKAALSKEKVIEIAENLYWGVRDYGDVVEFEFSSPAGEDFVFSVDADNVADNVWEYAQNFDAEEHAREVMDMPGAPSLRELLEDADEIKRELELLADEIWGAEVDKIRMEDIVGSVRRKSGARRAARKPVNASVTPCFDKYVELLGEVLDVRQEAVALALFLSDDEVYDMAVMNEFYESDIEKDYSDPRFYTNYLLDLVDEGVLDAYDVVNAIIRYMSEDDLRRYMEIYELTNLMDDDEYDEYED